MGIAGTPALNGAVFPDLFSPRRVQLFTIAAMSTPFPNEKTAEPHELESQRSGKSDDNNEEYLVPHAGTELHRGLKVSKLLIKSRENREHSISAPHL